MEIDDSLEITENAKRNAAYDNMEEERKHDAEVNTSPTLTQADFLTFTYFCLDDEKKKP